MRMLTGQCRRPELRGFGQHRSAASTQVGCLDNCRCNSASAPNAALRKPHQEWPAAQLLAVAIATTSIIMPRLPAIWPVPRIVSTERVATICRAAPPAAMAGWNPVAVPPHCPWSPAIPIPIHPRIARTRTWRTIGIRRWSVVSRRCVVNRRRRCVISSSSDLHPNRYARPCQKRSGCQQQHNDSQLPFHCRVLLSDELPA